MEPKQGTIPNTEPEPELRSALTARKERFEHRLAVVDHEISKLAEERQELLTKIGAVNYLLLEQPNLPPRLQSHHVREIGIAESLDEAFRVLRTHGPMHYREIQRTMSGTGISINGRDPAATLLSRIHRDPRFERMGRGTYRAAQPSH